MEIVRVVLREKVLNTKRRSQRKLDQHLVSICIANNYELANILTANVAGHLRQPVLASFFFFLVLFYPYF